MDIHYASEPFSFIKTRKITEKKEEEKAEKPYWRLHFQSGLPFSHTRRAPSCAPISNRQQLVIYEDDPSAPESSHDHPFTSEQMLCTYQCRQMVKSDFLDALSSAEKQAQDYQSKFEALNDELRKAGGS
nr:mitotic spindle checkpoint protein MAD1 [Ipomoea batatas]